MPSVILSRTLGVIASYRFSQRGLTRVAPDSGWCDSERPLVNAGREAVPLTGAGMRSPVHLPRELQPLRAGLLSVSTFVQQPLLARQCWSRESGSVNVWKRYSGSGALMRADIAVEGVPRFVRGGGCDLCDGTLLDLLAASTRLRGDASRPGPATMRRIELFDLRPQMRSPYSR
jgi:hypothetical protein